MRVVSLPNVQEVTTLPSKEWVTVRSARRVTTATIPTVRQCLRSVPPLITAPVAPRRRKCVRMAPTRKFSRAGSRTLTSAPHAQPATTARKESLTALRSASPDTTVFQAPKKQTRRIDCVQAVSSASLAPNCRQLASKASTPCQVPKPQRTALTASRATIA